MRICVPIMCRICVVAVTTVNNGIMPQVIRVKAVCGPVTDEWKAASGPVTDEWIRILYSPHRTVFETCVILDNSLVGVATLASMKNMLW